MKKFNELNINQDEGRFVGKKISIDDLIGKIVVVHAYKVEASRYDKGNGKRTVLQLNFDGVNRIMFTGSVILTEALNKIALLPKGFPFETTILGNKIDGFRFS